VECSAGNKLQPGQACILSALVHFTWVGRPTLPPAVTHLFKQKCFLNGHRRQAQLLGSSCRSVVVVIMLIKTVMSAQWLSLFQLMVRSPAAWRMFAVQPCATTCSLQACLKHLYVSVLLLRCILDMLHRLCFASFTSLVFVVPLVLVLLFACFQQCEDLEDLPELAAHVPSHAQHHHAE